jgi:type II secretory pathway component PulL
MSIMLTDAKHVAIYDSVTDRASGPVFTDEDLANDYLAWLDAKGLDFRRIDNNVHDALYASWFEARLDLETGELVPLTEEERKQEADAMWEEARRSG